MKNCAFPSVVLLILCILNGVQCNWWSNHGSCVSGSSLIDGNKAITQYYNDASYLIFDRKTDFTYKLGGKTYRVWLDKNKAMPFGDTNRQQWKTCNTGRSPCDGPVLSSGGECCYTVKSAYGIGGTECMRMDVW